MCETRLLLRDSEKMTRHVVMDVAQEHALSRCLSRCHDYGLLNNMFESLLRTGTYRGHPIDINHFLLNPPIRKTYIPFMDDYNIPYLSTILSVDYADNCQVHFKFPNDGFVYEEKAGTLYSRHKSDDWVALDDIADLFPALATALPHHMKATFFYSYKAHRMDIQVFSDKPELADVVVTFEDGEPYVAGRPLSVALPRPAA